MQGTNFCIVISLQGEEYLANVASSPMVAVLFKVMRLFGGVHAWISDNVSIFFLFS